MSPLVERIQCFHLRSFCAAALVVAVAHFNPIRSSARSAQTAEPPYVDLLRWEGVAEVPSKSLIAPEHFRISASVRWAPGAPREINRYRVRVVTADGRAVAYPLAAHETPGSSTRRLSVWIPAAAVRNRRASSVKVDVDVVDSVSGRSVSRNALTATARQFPRDGSGAQAPPDRFGWGAPLVVKGGGAQPLGRNGADPENGADLNEGPRGYQFARVFSAGAQSGFFVATTESRVDELKAMLKGYSPNLRAGEFVISADSPAIGVSPTQAETYLAALSQSEGLGLRYRLPSREEWLRLARAGRSTMFWWGDDPNNSAARQGANFKGAEKPVESPRGEDELDVIRPTPNGGVSLGGFRPNPWGLWHTFGNVSEWATDSSGDGFWMMGGNFRTERDSTNFRADDLEVKVKKGEPAPQPFVGLRIVADVTPADGKAIIETHLRKQPDSKGAFSSVVAAFDPESATATLSGRVADVSARLRVDELSRPLWFVACLSNQISVDDAPVSGDQVAAIGGKPVKSRVRPGLVTSGRIYYVPVAIRWGSRLPVEGSDYWINVYRRDNGARISGTQLNSRKIGRVTEIEIPIEAARMAASGLAITEPVTIAISLGKEPAETTNDSEIVSNVAELKWSIDAK
jgi:Sulfatase-modifying factor enzyme 1